MPDRSTVAAVLPFGVWIALMTLLSATAWGYAARSAATAAALAWACCVLKPRWRLSPRALAWGVAAGAFVAAFWIFPESWGWYRKWLLWPVGAEPPPVTDAPYDPAVCGWPLTVAKLVGSAFVIAPVEELFFRSFLYRRLQARDFRAVPLSRFDLSSFLWMVALFTLEHDRPVVAAIAGAAYGLLAIRFGLGSAIVAHVVTNLALGLHVIYRGEWWFW
jgi:CAAX prenyl protease-like protein